MNTTPETDEAFKAWQKSEATEAHQAWSLAAKLERERNRWRAIATRLAPYVEPDVWEGMDAHDALEDFEHENQKS